MGYVFEAFDERLRRKVAVKVMKPKFAEDEVSVQRFLREARALAATKHRHIVTIYDVGTARGRPFLAMEFLTGETLRQRLRRHKRLAVDPALRIATEIAAGLTAMHAQGVIHRDLKPDNIWLESADNSVRLIDFGLARVDGREAQLTRQGKVLGTPTYLSPEQARGEPVDARTDLYSLGVVMYRMLSGHLPHDEPSPAAQLAAIVARRPKPLQKLMPRLPAEVCGLVDQLLEKRPDDRIASARELVERLDEVVARRTSNRGKTRRRLPRWIAAPARSPRFWLVAFAALTPPLILTLAAPSLSPPRLEGPAARWEMPPRDPSRTLAVTRFTRAEAEIVFDGRGATAYCVASRPGRGDGQSPLLSIVNQPGVHRERRVAVFQFRVEPSKLPPGECVDATLCLTLHPQAASTGQRHLRVYGLVLPEAAADGKLTFVELERHKEEGTATALGDFFFDNANYSRGNVPEGIRFSSGQFIRFLRDHPERRLAVWIERVDISNGQTNLVADASVNDAEALRLPRLRLELVRVSGRGVSGPSESVTP